MAVSVTQIARRLKVSQPTVSAVLNGRGGNTRVSRKLADRIRAAAIDLGYRPNSAAQAVATGRFNAVGLLMSTRSYQSVSFGGFLAGVHEALEAEAMHLTITMAEDERLNEAETLPKILAQEMVDGLLLNYTHNIPVGLIREIDRHHIPSVWVNSKQAHNCVYIDDYNAGLNATRRLLELGHRRITFLDTIGFAYLKHGEVHYSHRDRQAGYVQAMREAGLTPVVHDLQGWYGEKCFPQAYAYLQGPDRPTAVVTYCEIEAIALAAAAFALNLRLGRDVSVVTFDKRQPDVGPLLSMMLLPEREMGKMAVATLLEVIAQPQRSLPAVAVPMTWKEGTTLGPCPDVCKG